MIAAALVDSIGTLPDAGTVAATLESSVAHLPAPERESAIVAALRAARPATESWLRSHGATPRQAADSVADVDRKLERYGLRGTGLDWFCAVVTARVVTVGRLQFEIGATTADGRPAWDVHVPESGPLAADACDRAFAEAPSVLRALAPDLAGEQWQCRSWFLDPGLPTALGPSSNLVRFARRFRLAPSGPDDVAEGDESVAKFVFGVPLPTARAATPTGRLDEAVLAQWRTGEHWTVRTGTAPVASGA
ncbi:hypothetical protein DEJ28_17445 [Curtobacterium sp. MCPF17_002]|uniref:hypothetical protein n=1 Tax=Curtobacterium sp. MCPF17_002 TaxID=2175645 RepID=UPI000DA72CE6|nr:hypothetical protein [Curtobacterium sp. MCPF17_002]WIB77405.1 hypothetical protein DEJ28_17445 [Curtobacterium sp. MCPF17_002]